MTIEVEASEALQKSNLPKEDTPHLFRVNIFFTANAKSAKIEARPGEVRPP